MATIPLLFNINTGTDLFNTGTDLYMVNASQPVDGVWCALADS